MMRGESLACNRCRRFWQVDIPDSETTRLPCGHDICLRCQQQAGTFCPICNTGEKRAPVNAPDISYIVSAYDRPDLLPICLWSIKAQTHPNFECLVTDNATDPAIAAKHEMAVTRLDDYRFGYVRTADKIQISDCYWSAEWAIEHRAKGNWLTFPCDDTFLVQEFGQRMLTAAVGRNLDFVYTRQVLIGGLASLGSGYRIHENSPGRIVKTCYLVRRSAFPGFRSKPQIQGAWGQTDWMLGSDMIAAGAKCGGVEDILVVHQ